MADQESPAIGRPGTTLPNVTMDATERTYDFTYALTGRTISRIIQLVSDADWLVAFPTPDNYAPVAANQPYAIELSNEVTTVYFKTSGGTAILSAVIAR